jgi:EAL domain-containing protein (putative c-di-GMP-specific phosphodiesterase class I)
MALEGATARGRIPPMVVRLNEPARSRSTLAAMLVPGKPPRLCLTLGPVAVAPAETETAEGAPDARDFAREAENRMREGSGGQLALVEVHNWDRVREALTGEQQKALRAGIAQAFGADGSGAMACEVADGLYSVLMPESSELPDMLQRLDSLVRATPGGKQARVEGMGLSLDAGTLAPSQAGRALRYALTPFRAGGTAAARAAGGDSGLQDVIAQADIRAQGLRSAIAERKFRLKYQPVVSLVDRAVHHFECLLRPFPLAGGPPQTTHDFVVFTEAVGLTEELDCAVTETALAALRVARDTKISVNVSGLSLQSDVFCARLLGMLNAPEVGAKVRSRLLIELTETAEIEDMEVAAANIAAIRACGAAVCLDDFGAGAAAFRYLREFQFDFVKIDGRYVRNAPLGTRERSFVASMVDLAGAVGARVIAEMVETDEEAQLMRMLGVEFGQGYLFGRPGVLPASDR